MQTIEQNIRKAGELEKSNEILLREQNGGENARKYILTSTLKTKVLLGTETRKRKSERDIFLF